MRALQAAGPTMRFRRYESLPSAMIPLDNSAIDPPPEAIKYNDVVMDLEATYAESKKVWDARYEQLRNSPSFYNFNKIRRKKQMFNEDEVNFIEETAKKDLNAVNSKIENLVNEMARLGRNLSDLKIVQSRLSSILQSIQEEHDDKNPYNPCRGAC